MEYVLNDEWYNEILIRWLEKVTSGYYRGICAYDRGICAFGKY